MKGNRIARLIGMLAIILVLASLVVIACARPAPAPDPAPAPASATKASPLAAIIEGAKKERTVTALLTPTYDEPSTIELLKKAIKDKYGVELDIKAQKISGMAATVAKAIMETRTGAEPTYDIISFSTDYIPRGTKEGIFEMVDWRSLLEPGTSPKVQYDHPDLKAGVVIYGSTIGLTYNPEKISAAEAPRKLADLADPKWKGRLGVHSYASHWARFAFMLGKERTLSDLRAILKTKPILLDSFSLLNLRYLAGEIDLAYTIESYIDENRGRGKPTAWQNMDMVEIRDYQLVVMKGTKRPNAAKLIALFFAGPEGAKFTMEVVKKSHHMYAGNRLYDAVEAAKKEGMPVYTWESFPGLLDFMLSPEYDKWQKETQLIIDTTK